MENSQEGEMESASGSKTSKPSDRSVILWHVIVDSLMRPNFEPYIRWTGNGLEFVLLNAIVFFTEFMMRKNENAEPTPDNDDPGERWKDCLITQENAKDRLRGLASVYYNPQNKEESETKPWIEKRKDMTGGFLFKTAKSICDRLNMTEEALLHYAKTVGKKYDYPELKKTTNKAEKRNEPLRAAAEVQSTSGITQTQESPTESNVTQTIVNMHEKTTEELMDLFIPREKAQMTSGNRSPESSNNSSTWMSFDKENIPNKPCGYIEDIATSQIQTHCSTSQDITAIAENIMSTETSSLKRSANVTSDTVQKKKSRTQACPTQDTTINQMQGLPSPETISSEHQMTIVPINMVHHSPPTVNQNVIQAAPTTTNSTTHNYHEFSNSILHCEPSVFTDNDAIQYLQALDANTQYEDDFSTFEGISEFDSRDVKDLFQYLGNENNNQTQTILNTHLSPELKKCSIHTNN